jgi:DNA-binding response OmpR family regulator
MLKVLVAEDEPPLAQFYVTLLRQWNCETVVEHTGKDAVRRAASFRPDIALLGVIMEDMAVLKLLSSCWKSVPELRSSSLLSWSLPRR